MVEKLTEKQMVFCRSVARGRNPTEAAMDAGYKNGKLAGEKLMKQEKILREIDSLQTETAAADKRENAEGEEFSEREEIANQDEILAFLTQTMRESKETKIRIKAAELLGKRAKLFEEKEKETQSRIVILNDIPK